MNKVVDHLGNEYNTIKEMCDVYGVGYFVYDARLRRGWTVERALTEPLCDITTKDHLGNSYPSLKEMCEAYNISTSSYRYRINSGWTMKKALTTKTNIVEPIDHLGNNYSSIEEMCRIYGITSTTYRNRINQGLTVKEALIRPKNWHPNKIQCKDHLGNIYSSINDMCRFYRISAGAYSDRIKAGWTVEKALTTPSLREKVIDFEGNIFSSTKEMCKHYGMSTSKYYHRLRLGLSQKEAFTLPDQIRCSRSNITSDKEKSIRLFEDHKGNAFPSKKQMCKFYNIKLGTFEKRIRDGLSLEDALTLPLRYDIKKECFDHKGIKYSSIKEMCDAYGINTSVYTNRIEHMHLSLEQALTQPVNSEFIIKQRNPQKRLRVTDHKGNVFANIKEMCKHYGIPVNTYKTRIKRGYSKEEALTAVYEKGTPFITINGTTYNREELRRLAKINGIHYDSLKRHLKKGQNIEQAIKRQYDTTVYDHKGNKFPSISQMCKHYGISTTSYHHRTKLGFNLEDVLTMPKDYDLQCCDHLGNVYASKKAMCEYYDIPVSLLYNRLRNNWDLEEALTVPSNMYIGEYRVAECLKRLNVKFYHDCSIKTIFSDLDLSIDWKEFLSELQNRLGFAGYNWSKQKIQKLRPDFVLYTDEADQIRGVIEFDGEQHQNFVEFFFKTIEEFYKRSNTDFIKQSFWEYMKIPMLRIRHDQIDMVDDMVKDFINYPRNYIYNHNTYLSEDEYWSILTKQKTQLEMAFATT